VSRVGRRRRASQPQPFAHAGATTGSGGRTTTTAASARCTALQATRWCTGAPGVLAGAWEYLDEELLLAGAELIWRAGPHGDEKGHGICHGTSGNGFALLKAFARTGDERWLIRARRFAVHALGQVERLRAANGSGRYSLWTGDVGTALFAAACLDCDARYPILDIV
jgi:Lanthionine synthetase C-like protein